MGIIGLSKHIAPHFSPSVTKVMPSRLSPFFIIFKERSSSQLSSISIILSIRTLLLIVCYSK